MPASDHRRSRARVPFVLKFLLTAALVAAVVVYAAAPPPPQSAALSRLPDGRTVAGAYHIHTTRSDGALDREGVALAASRAGLTFAIFTERRMVRILIGEPIFVDGSDPRAVSPDKALLRLAECIASVIRQYPEQWLVLDKAWVEDRREAHS